MYFLIYIKIYTISVELTETKWRRDSEVKKKLEDGKLFNLKPNFPKWLKIEMMPLVNFKGQRQVKYVICMYVLTYPTLFLFDHFYVM